MLEFFWVEEEITVAYFSFDVEEANRIFDHSFILNLLVWVQTSLPEPIPENALLIFIHQPVHQLLLEFNAESLPAVDAAVGMCLPRPCQFT